MSMTDMPKIKVRYLNDLTLVEIANERISNFDEALIDGIDKTLFWVIQENAPIRMILSFSQVVFFDSAVIITLLRLKKRVAESGGIIKLCSLRPNLYDIFVTTQLDQVFELYEDEEAAIQSFDA
jgi:anti-anti-sigma factor